MIYYVYIIKDSNGRPYTGLTKNIDKRLEEHNSGLSGYTKSSAGSWSLSWFCGFKDKEKAASFERYLKTGSGIAFSRKRLT